MSEPLTNNHSEQAGSKQLVPVPTSTMAAEGNHHFYPTNFGKNLLRVIIYFPEGHPLGQVLMRQCRESDFTSVVVGSAGAFQEELERVRQQVAVVVNVNGSSIVQEVSKYIQSKGLQDIVTLIGIVSAIENSKTSDSLMNELLEAGFSRVLTSEECQHKLLWNLKMLERNEIELKRKVGFGQALFEAVEQSNDAIQIISDSKTVYINRAFVDMSGYSRDEAVGRPAMDILKCFDNKWDNGPKGAFQKKELRWDGECLGRRKSGSVLKQYLKLIPVRSTANHITHHVTIQRLLSFEEQRPRSTSADGQLVKKQNSLPSIPKMPTKFIPPIMQAVHKLSQAREKSDCPSNVRASLEEAMDLLRNTDLYTISRAEVPRTRGLVRGLLTRGSTSDMAMRISTHSHPHIRHTPITPPPPQVQEALDNIETWDFNIIALEKGSSNEPLYYVGMQIFKQFEMCEVLNVDDTVVASWLKLMEQNYHRSNTYHNSTHAADVLQATAYLIKALQDELVKQGEILEPMEVAALLISAVTHDVDHPGRTNPFMCNTQHELALLYNDNAVLENHHVSFSFKLTQQHQQANIFQSLDTANYRSLRASIVDLVLATDMAKHFEHLAKFKQTEEGSGTNLLATKDTREKWLVIKRILVKCADISNPCRPWELCTDWAKRIAEEYFSQTEEEKERALPVVFPDFDRQTCKLHATQMKFIDFFISGLFEAWHNYCPIPTLMRHLNSNYEAWKSQSVSPPSSEEEPDAPS